jgi:hypothetical protein
MFVSILQSCSLSSDLRAELARRISQVVGQIRANARLVSTWTLRLGRDRVGVFTGDKDKSTIKQFLNSYVLAPVD